MSLSEDSLSSPAGKCDLGMLANVFERVTDAFVALDKNWRYIYVNKRAGEIFGRDPDYLIGKHIWTEFPEGVGQPFHLAYERAMADQKPIRFEEFYPPYKRWFENIVYPSPEGISIYFHDITARKQAEELIYGQNTILEMIAKGAPLKDSLTALLKLLEKQEPDMLCSILLLEKDGVHVRHGACPSLPSGYIEAIDGEPIGPVAGSCGTAMYRREVVIVEDIATDPLWAKYRNKALSMGLRACWSTPIMDAQRRVLGSYAIYYRKPGRPAEVHRKLIEIATHIAAIAINRERSEDELRSSEERYRRIVQTSQEGIWMIDAEERTSFVNPKMAQLLGYTVEEMLGRSPLDFMDKDMVEPAKANLERRRKGIAEQHEFQFRKKDGSRLDAQLSTNPIYDEKGAYAGALAMITDISERKKTLEALKASEARYRKLFEYAPVGILIADGQSVYLDANAAICKMLGYDREALIGMHGSQIVAPPEIKHIAPALDEIKARQDYSREWKLKRKDGSMFFAEVVATVMPDGTLLGIIRDITERKEAEEALFESEVRFRQLAENIQEVFWVVESPSRKFLYVSPMFEKIWGKPRETLYADSDAWTKSIHPNDQERVRLACQKLDHGLFDESYRIVRPDNSIRWIRDRAFPVYASDGKVQRVVGTAMDITEQRKLEEQFHQAQKMEAVGQLAGGVAHDFNNLLMIIGGHTELLCNRTPPNDPLLQDLLPIRSAAERATELTRQLLAFSRKQVQELRVIDLNAVIVGSQPILRRAVGDFIELAYRLDTSIDKVKADPGQVSQVLLNLVVNAHDAMPNGGKIVIETSNVDLSDTYVLSQLEIKGGKYVQLTVSDNGVGMSKEIQAHIFEPFFTTKELGKGTGLGLAVVHGIVKQSGGHIEIESDVGRGTAFKIYLPSAGTAVSDQQNQIETKVARPGTETVLLVEDEKSVRTFLEAALRAAGYTVLPAANGNEALQIAETHAGPIHVLLTDVIMPGINGPQLAEAIRTRTPALKTIFMSGYTHDAALNHGIQTGSAAFIQKPFGPAALADKLREVLDSQKC